MREQPPNRRRRWVWIATIAVGLLVATYLLVPMAGTDTPTVEFDSEFRAPVANPVLEPDRPDLIEEPRIDEP
jgi:hypothetical protein